MWRRKHRVSPSLVLVESKLKEARAQEIRADQIIERHKRQIRENHLGPLSAKALREKY